MIITLIGSRSTPKDILLIMKEFVQYGNRKGYLFRSGGADGADSVVTYVAALAEIYLPWRGFNGVIDGIVPNFTEYHKRLVGKVHPAYHNLSQGALKLHMRNLHQVLGKDIANPTPSDVVVCWTENGEIIGGTATAIRIAMEWNVPVINLGTAQGIEDLKKLMEEN